MMALLKRPLDKLTSIELDVQAAVLVIQSFRKQEELQP